MMYPFMTLNDNTEITHSEMKEDGSVKVYIETPIHMGFKSIECFLPKYDWKNNNGYSEEELKYYDEYIHSLSHIIMQLATEGGFDNASSF